jgi:hypothetical protein
MTSSSRRCSTSTSLKPIQTPGIRAHAGAGSAARSALWMLRSPPPGLVARGRQRSGVLSADVRVFRLPFVAGEQATVEVDRRHINRPGRSHEPVDRRIASIACLLLVAGCGPLFSTSTPSPPNGTESIPAPASLVVRGEPSVTQRQLVLTLLRPDQPNFRRDVAVAAGAATLADFPVSAGVYRLVGPLQACTVDVTLAPNTNTRLLLRSGDGSDCSFEVIGVDTSGY